MWSQDVNKEAGAEDTFKKIGEAYEVGACLPCPPAMRQRLMHGCNKLHEGDE